MSKMREAFEAWKANDGWEFADREAAWKWMYEAGYQAAIDAVKEGGPVAWIDAEGTLTFKHNWLAKKGTKLFKIPEDV